jgi:plastocyanin
MARSVPSLLLAVAAAVTCDGSSTAPAGGGASAHSVQILVDGAPVAVESITSLLGSIPVSADVRDASGTTLAPAQYRADWGTTNPGLVVVTTDEFGTHVTPMHDGTAKIILQVGALRDTVTFLVHQVPYFIRVEQDTIVVPLASARILEAPGASAEEWAVMRLTAYRIDENGTPVENSDEPIRYEVIDSLITVTPEGHGDTAQVVGLEAGSARFFVRFGDFARVVVAQVVDAISLVVISETPNHVVSVHPDTARITPGAAVVFLNGSSSILNIAGNASPSTAWRVGPIPPTGREAQRFTEPGVYTYSVAGVTHAIRVEQ